MELGQREFKTVAQEAEENEAMNEAAIYMSLALDGALDSADQARFDFLLARYPGVQVEWQAWQALDLQFQQTPAALPAPDFVAKFEHRLLQQERRRKLWLGSLVGLLFTGTLAGALAIAITLASAVLFPEAGVAVGGVSALANFGTAFGNWFEALLSTLGTLLGTPQALGFGALYVTLTAAILYVWTRFLQRTTRMQELDEAIGIEDLAQSA